MLVGFGVGKVCVVCWTQVIYNRSPSGVSVDYTVQVLYRLTRYDNDYITLVQLFAVMPSLLL